MNTKDEEVTIELPFSFAYLELLPEVGTLAGGHTKIPLATYTPKGHKIKTIKELLVKKEDKVYDYCYYKDKGKKPSYYHFFTGFGTLIEISSINDLQIFSLALVKDGVWEHNISNDFSIDYSIFEEIGDSMVDTKEYSFNDLFYSYNDFTVPNDYVIKGIENVIQNCP